MEKDCEFCEETHRRYELRSYENWFLQLYASDQYFIGRCVAVLKTHKVDITELTPKEREELFGTVLEELHTALDETFQPDLYNYGSFGNDARHFHLHIVPRYKSSISYNGRTFIDEYWGRTYQQHQPSVRLHEPELQELRSHISESLPMNE
jgi:diadenosine tetraphosphate (Ap4A) HIT family hydrolase